ncbi:hypothetical protein RGI145_24070 (plasmid) [Roseomonas gilardii]|uniref:Peptidase S8/S53 domain-containing protein n=1 Tax=Roseomonas gilardii TaxID=257708 RepID=A0A1L7ANR0_9PROT|nr:S8 family serine peptidase [Roseomonas gilardii]APT60426.1 hypothetical protein RGI145_24070 [Roseomonas gilardii]
MVSPIQIVLNPENYEKARDGGGGGAHTDFFFGKDVEFKRHQRTLNKQLNGLADALKAQRDTDLGYVKVKLRRAAWAKSHRPFAQLFKDQVTPLVGGLDLGELIVEAKPDPLRRVAGKVLEAEPQSRTHINPQTGKTEPYPSVLRSEVGAVESVSLYGPEDRVEFSVDTAVDWLSRSETGGAYEVELFTNVPPRASWDALMRPQRRESGTELRISASSGGDRTVLAPFSSSKPLHGRLLHFLSHHPLVRSVALPGIIVRAPDLQGSTQAQRGYRSVLDGFFNEVDQAVGDVRRRSSVRIFNMSLNIQRPATPKHYSSDAARLDQIADEHGALLFLSAGNTSPQGQRAEWPRDLRAALGTIAAARDDGLLTPAESFRSVAVAAVNPPGCTTSVSFAPARYSRRGPGVRSGFKPDLAHVGGSGSPQAPMGHGLFSTSPTGGCIDGCGTSYASPLVAKTAAVLDHLIEGEVSRETLVALLVHNASLPEPLRAKETALVARHLVGFGVPATAEAILNSSDHAITLVFASRIRPGQQIVFPFRWPPSLTLDGKCRGYAKLSLASSPPLDARYGAEVVRVNIEAALQQQQKDGKWMGRLKPIHLPLKAEGHSYEAERIEHEFKWSPVKSFQHEMKQGVGPSIDWRLRVGYITRAKQLMPEEGVPFTAVLTIADLKDAAPVFNEMRLELQRLGARIADIRTAARITTRV